MKVELNLNFRPEIFNICNSMSEIYAPNTDLHDWKCNNVLFSITFWTKNRGWGDNEKTQIPIFYL